MEKGTRGQYWKENGENVAKKGSGQRQVVRLDAAVDGQSGEEWKSLSI